MHNRKTHGVPLCLYFTTTDIFFKDFRGIYKKYGSEYKIRSHILCILPNRNYSSFSAARSAITLSATSFGACS